MLVVVSNDFHLFSNDICKQQYLFVVRLLYKLNDVLRLFFGYKSRTNFPLTFLVSRFLPELLLVVYFVLTYLFAFTFFFFFVVFIYSFLFIYTFIILF